MKNDIKFGRGRRPWLTFWLLCALCITFAPGPGPARRLEQVITFDNVAVQGMDRANDTPELAHRELLVEAFWVQNWAARAGSFKLSHLHPADVSTGFEAQHFAGPNKVRDIYIRSLDGNWFGVKSLRYRVTRNQQIPRKPLSIEGFSTFGSRCSLPDPSAPGSGSGRSS